MIGSFVLLALVSGAAPIDIAVLPVRHSAEATKLLADMVSHVEGVRAVSLIDVDRVLGPEASKKIAACTEDQCVVAAIRPVHADGILLGSVVPCRVGDCRVLEARVRSRHAGAGGDN